MQYKYSVIIMNGKQISRGMKQHSWSRHYAIMCIEKCEVNS
jgi:hypothetical protein